MGLDVDDMRAHVLETLQAFGFLTPPIYETRAVLYQVARAVIDHIQADGVGHVLTDAVGISTGTGYLRGTDGFRMADNAVQKLADLGIIQEVPDQYLGLKALCYGINKELVDGVVSWSNINTTAMHDDPTQAQTFVTGLDAVNLRDRVVSRMVNNGFDLHDPVAMQGLVGLSAGIVDEIEQKMWIRNDVVIDTVIDVPGSIN